MVMQKEMNRMNDQIVFTPASVLTLLSEIEELKGQEIAFQEQDDTIALRIGDAIYNIETAEADEVEVSDEVIDQVDQANEEGYDELGWEIEEDAEPIEGGIIKELIKTLAIGGLVRLTKNALTKS